MTRERLLKGSCLCGAVRYEAKGPFRPVIACHCVECRKSTGNYFTSSAAYKENFHLTEDRGLKWYQSGANTRRGFCGECGATLLFEHSGRDRISFSGGTIDGESGLKIAGNIFAAEKGDYYSLDHEPVVRERDDPELTKIPK